MAKIYKSIEELVGKTPLLELTNIEKELNLDAKIFAKLEFLNPAGSAKDRIARQMIKDAEEEGILKKGGTIIEPTSGNTGIGLAAIGIPKGYRVIIVLPDSMSEERQKILKAYGAELVLTPGREGMSAAIKKAEELANKIPGSFIAGQFNNPSNPKAHYLTTGPEILEDTDGDLDFYVAGVGTGGTLTGTGKFLKEKNNNIQVIGVGPKDSIVFKGDEPKNHNLQGIGPDFIPNTFNKDYCDDIIGVSNEEAYEMGRMLAKKEGILVGISGGAALFGAIKLAKHEKNKGKRIVVLLPDTGDRYLSTEMFN